MRFSLQALDTIGRSSSVWSSLGMLAHVERHKLRAHHRRHLSKYFSLLPNAYYCAFKAETSSDVLASYGALYAYLHPPAFHDPRQPEPHRTQIMNGVFGTERDVFAPLCLKTIG